MPSGNAKPTAQRSREYMARKKVKKVEWDRMYEEVLAAIVITFEEPEEGGKVVVNGELSKDSDAFATFQHLASDLKLSNADLWQKVVTEALKRAKIRARKR